MPTFDGDWLGDIADRRRPGVAAFGGPGRPLDRVAASREGLALSWPGVLVALMLFHTFVAYASRVYKKTNTWSRVAGLPTISTPAIRLKCMRSNSIHSSILFDVALTMTFYHGVIWRSGCALAGNTTDSMYGHKDCATNIVMSTTSRKPADILSHLLVGVSTRRRAPPRV